MDGAYLVWEGLLLALGGGSRIFLKMFIEHAVAHLSALDRQNSLAQTEKPGMYYWLERIVFSREWSIETGRWGWDKHASLPELIMEQCCLYPCRWTAQLGRQILEEADVNDEVVQYFEPFFRASLTSEDQPAEERPDVMMDVQGEVQAVETIETSSFDDPSIRGWRLASENWRPRPIGVV